MIVNEEANLVEHYGTLQDLKSDFRNANLFNLITSLVTGQKVIDIGCGLGFFSTLLKARGKDVVGIEPSSGMRDLAREINPDIPITADLNLNEKVDTVVMLDVLEHIEDDSKQVRDIHSVLNSGGEFVFVVPAHQVLYGERDKKVGHYRRYSKKSLEDLLTANGFSVQSLRHWNALGFLPYIVAEKVLGKPLQSKLRGSGRVGVFSRIARTILNFWFSRIENNFDFGFGLSIIGVAKKMS